MREQFEKYWAMFYRPGAIYDALVAAGVTNAQIKLILQHMRDSFVAKLQAKKAAINSEITKTQSEVP